MQQWLLAKHTGGPEVTRSAQNQVSPTRVSTGLEWPGIEMHVWDAKL